MTNCNRIKTKSSNCTSRIWMTQMTIFDWHPKSSTTSWKIFSSRGKGTKGWAGSTCTSRWKIKSARNEPNPLDILIFYDFILTNIWHIWEYEPVVTTSRKQLKQWQILLHVVPDSEQDGIWVYENWDFGKSTLEWPPTTLPQIIAE